jgi:hypothetical protein
MLIVNAKLCRSAVNEYVSAGFTYIKIKTFFATGTLFEYDIICWKVFSELTEFCSKLSAAIYDNFLSVSIYF